MGGAIGNGRTGCDGFVLSQTFMHVYISRQLIVRLICSVKFAAKQFCISL